MQLGLRTVTGHQAAAKGMQEIHRRPVRALWRLIAMLGTLAKGLATKKDLKMSEAILLGMFSFRDVRRTSDFDMGTQRDRRDSLLQLRIGGHDRLTRERL